MTGGWVFFLASHESESSGDESIQKLFLIHHSIMVEGLVHISHPLSGQVNDPLYFWVCPGHILVHHEVSWPTIQV